MQEEEKRLKNEGRETLEETVQKLISKAGSHMESTLIGTGTPSCIYKPQNEFLPIFRIKLKVVSGEKEGGRKHAKSIPVGVGMGPWHWRRKKFADLLPVRIKSISVSARSSTNI